MKAKQIARHIAFIFVIGLTQQALAQLLGGRMGGSLGGSLGGSVGGMIGGAGGLGRMNMVNDMDLLIK